MAKLNKIEKHQAEAHAKHYPAFKVAKVVLVDEDGNVRFNPTDEEREEFTNGKTIFTVKDSTKDEPTSSRDNSREGE